MYGSYVFSFSLFFPVTVFVCDFYSCNFFFPSTKKSHRPLIFIYRYCNSYATYHHLFFYQMVHILQNSSNFFKPEFCNKSTKVLCRTSCGYSPFCNIYYNFVTNSRAKPQQTPSVEKHAHPPRVVLLHNTVNSTHFTKFPASNLQITSTPDADNMLHQRIL